MVNLGELPNSELSQQVHQLRQKLSSILNRESIALLVEIEFRIAGENSLSKSTKPKSKSKKALKAAIEHQKLVEFYLTA
ncbi:hypothetical protein LX64_04147 [Chitinophaga skermanii]|uniref:Uncharacterized protein n=1 Tax=Chitinophaga skermanii TaxID=331697 RepID=A0A327Q809_9BACT|nr:hypothetical protein [Chitinophaga skermanii]RAJ00441.1 hypothetical protein LX64_04147 [Chitinophaga skermanii]